MVSRIRLWLCRKICPPGFFVFPDDTREVRIKTEPMSLAEQAPLVAEAQRQAYELGLRVDRMREKPDPFRVHPPAVDRQHPSRAAALENWANDREEARDA